MKFRGFFTGRVIKYLILCLILTGASGCSSKGLDKTESRWEAAVASIEQNNWDAAVDNLREAAREAPADAVKARVLESLILISHADSSTRVTEAYLAAVNKYASGDKEKADALVKNAEKSYGTSQASLKAAKEAAAFVLKSFPGQKAEFDFSRYKIIIEDESSIIYEHLVEYGEPQTAGDMEKAYYDDVNFVFAGSLLYAMGYNPEEISGTPKLSGNINWPAYFQVMGMALSDDTYLKKVIELTAGEENNPYRLEAMAEIE